MHPDFLGDTVRERRQTSRVSVLQVRLNPSDIAVLSRLTSGSTPLHFAAANGHAQIAQILLTCGAVHNKMDKNGMTPEALAEINGHTEVIRVLRDWEHLKATDPSVA